MRFDSEQFQDSRVSGGGTRYFLVCETCQERVTQTRPGMAILAFEADDATLRDLRVVHNGACDIYGSEPHVRWLELDRFLLFLVQNSTEGLRTALENVEHRREWGLEG